MPGFFWFCYRPHPKDGEGNIFSLFVICQFTPGGTPFSRWGGTLFPGLDRGGTPFPGLDGGYPIQLTGGYPLPRSGRGATPFLGLEGGFPIQLMGGTPFPGLDGGGETPSSWCGIPWGTPSRGTPIQVQVGGTPWQGYPPYRSSITCTCYAVGGVHLAFTQEDFLVLFFFQSIFCKRFSCDNPVKLSPFMGGGGGTVISTWQKLLPPLIWQMGNSTQGKSATSMLIIFFTNLPFVADGAFHW